MVKVLNSNPRKLIADEGKMLTDGGTYSPVVYLGKNENPDNWQEMDESEVAENEELESMA